MTPLLDTVLIGAGSGCVTTVLLQPFDLVKTRMQAPTAKLNFRQTVKSVYVNEGMKRFWRGLVPSLLRVVPGVGLYYGSIELVSRYIPGGYSTYRSMGRDLAIGFVARSVSSVSLMPITVIKTRFESAYFSYASLKDAAMDIAKTQKFRGFFSGLVPTLLRDAPFSGVYLMFYRWQLNQLSSDVMSSNYSGFARFGCGVTAGLSACVITQPFDMAKTLMQTLPNEHKSFLRTLVVMKETFGWSGFFRGLVPRSLRRTLFAAISWTFFDEVLNRWLTPKP